MLTKLHTIVPGIVLLLCGVGAHPAYTQPHSWSPAGGTSGWHVGSIDIVRSNPSKLYLSASPFTFAVSTDYGRNWVRTGSGGAYSRVRSHPLDPMRILRMNYNGSTWHYRSTDGGYTWTLFDDYPDDCGNVLDFDPQQPDVVYMGWGRVIKRSFDGGMTWNDTIFFQPPVNGWLNTFAIHPKNTKILYLGFSLGIYKSTDRGASWTTLPVYTSMEPTLISVAVDPSDTAVVYAGIQGGSVTQGTVKKSTNGGATWFEIAEGLPPLNRRVNALAVNPAKPSELLAGMRRELGGTGDPLFRTTNGGQSWESYSDGLAPMTIRAIEFDTTGERVYIGGAGVTDIGVYYLDRTTSVGEPTGGVPAILSLSAYPNPFNSTTKLRFSLPYATPIRLRVFDLLGREVLPVVEEERYDPGEHEMEIDASGLASGVYIASLQAGELHRMAKLLLAR